MLRARLLASLRRSSLSALEPPAPAVTPLQVPKRQQLVRALLASVCSRLDRRLY